MFTGAKAKRVVKAQAKKKVPLSDLDESKYSPPANIPRTFRSIGDR